MNFFFASGDAPFFFKEQLKTLPFFPFTWHGDRGFGQSMLSSLWVEYPILFITQLLSRLGISWFFIDKMWWSLVFILAIYGTYEIGKTIGLSKKNSILSSLIYSTNTYILLLFDGGQLGVALAYAFVPWVLSCVLLYFMKKKQKPTLRETVKISIFLSVLIFLDLRIAYVFLVLLALLLVVLFLKKQIIFTKYIFIIPLIIIFVNAFWIFPTIQYKDSLHSVVAETNIGESNISFFSVADFSHALALLHPNYPENLFGKVYFLKAEFLLIPLLAFIFFLAGAVSPVFLGFGLLAFIGAFLSKGTQEPFGQIYDFLFNTVPGFFLFRDPTKWYILTAISYTILIPQSIELLEKKIRIKNWLIIGFILFWIFSLRFIFIGNVNGNITPPVLTIEYESLKNLLVEDKKFGRTLWLPTVERFGYSSEMHPAISASDIFIESSFSGILRLLDNENSVETFKSVGVSYIIVPDDIERRIFLNDYKYDEVLRQNFITKIETNPYITRLREFNRLAVYKISDTSSLFMLNEKSVQFSPVSKDSWNVMLPERSTESTLSVLIGYDPNWRIVVDGIKIKPVLTKSRFMSFSVPSGKKDVAILEYQPTASAKNGAIISGITLIFLFFMLVFPIRK